MFMLTRVTSAVGSLLCCQPSSTSKTGRFIRAKHWALFTEPTRSCDVSWALYLFLNPNTGYIWITGVATACSVCSRAPRPPFSAVFARQRRGGTLWTAAPACFHHCSTLVLHVWRWNWLGLVGLAQHAGALLHPSWNWSRFKSSHMRSCCFKDIQDIFDHCSWCKEGRRFTSWSWRLILFLLTWHIGVWRRSSGRDDTRRMMSWFCHRPCWSVFLEL